ncbi:hypothetical protein SCP_1003380 [Sparassis crispa]|uniref:Uncharacterized protein n=1 Tax=Sparassis crispa TaxID=139825 RepID=A0A401GY19_9APHY|nr:hypothetical protein SCP_1003380 [Sparassis crispa]GBE87091.1 hypothetical protein SCP_1003380 [Sparassis crispa]
MPGPRNAKKKKQTRDKKISRRKASRQLTTEPAPRPLAPQTPQTPQPRLKASDDIHINHHDHEKEERPINHKDDAPTPHALTKTLFIHDPGNGPRVRDVDAFLASSFAAPPSFDDPLCAEFAQDEVLEMLCAVLPEETAQILWYNKSRTTARICPACQRLYRLGDILPDPVAAQGEPDPASTYISPLLSREQALSGLCSPVCFVLAAYSYPGAIRSTWGRTADELNDATWDTLGGPGVRADEDDMGLGMLLKMTRCHDLGLAQLLFPDLDTDCGDTDELDHGQGQGQGGLRMGLERMRVGP